MKTSKTGQYIKYFRSQSELLEQVLGYFNLKYENGSMLCLYQDKKPNEFCK